ncbi:MULTISPECIES: hypothetical protein [unclassified Duganella]|uniref:hypothetical protein n=1 Tax=unclassified Duganella TaxID=2636909 RepID=UPI000E351623|nr:MULTISPECIES: hypothetical protein [unclassified Duganella]RFP08095.1 hypothetical protein D0T23_30140 [Duganella sp. BJB475]RFP36224.1 hypothetical protein D0T21_07270 [Duganella sp. BJB476]
MNNPSKKLRVIAISFKILCFIGLLISAWMLATHGFDWSMLFLLLSTAGIISESNARIASMLGSDASAALSNNRQRKGEERSTETKVLGAMTAVALLCLIASTIYSLL